MATVNITLKADFTVTDDGGDYENITHANLNQANNDVGTRKEAYKKKYKRQGRGNRKTRDKINVDNQCSGGVVTVGPVSKEDA